MGFTLLAVSALASAGGTEDDLAVVKRATAATQERPSGDPSAVTRATLPTTRTGKPQWLKIRIIERGAKRAKVTVNLPWALVRAVGDDWPLDRDYCKERKVDNKKHSWCSIRLSEVLEALESGQDLVQIDDEDATVRIWVE